MFFNLCDVQNSGENFTRFVEAPFEAGKKNLFFCFLTRLYISMCIETGKCRNIKLRAKIFFFKLAMLFVEVFQAFENLDMFKKRKTVILNKDASTSAGWRLSQFCHIFAIN